MRDVLKNMANSGTYLYSGFTKKQYYAIHGHFYFVGIKISFSSSVIFLIGFS